MAPDSAVVHLRDPTRQAKDRRKQQHSPEYKDRSEEAFGRPCIETDITEDRPEHKGRDGEHKTDGEYELVKWAFHGSERRRYRLSGTGTEWNAASFHLMLQPIEGICSFVTEPVSR